jgi:hypothetical protein
MLTALCSMACAQVNRKSRTEDARHRECEAGESVIESERNAGRAETGATGEALQRSECKGAHLEDQSLLPECVNDALHVGAEGLAIGVIEGPGDRVGDVMGMMAAVAVGEHQGGSEVEVAAAGPGVVAQQESSADRLEAEIAASSGVAAPERLLLHITKISMGQRSATYDISSFNIVWTSLLKTLWKGR